MSSKSVRTNQYLPETQANIDIRGAVSEINLSDEARELNSTLIQMKTLARTLLVEIESLTLTQCREIESGLDFYEMVKLFEINLIERALLKTGGHQRRAARILGLRAGTLSAKMKLYDIKAKSESETGSHEGRLANAAEWHELIS